MAAVSATQPYDLNNGQSSEASNRSAPIDFSGTLSIWKDINFSELQQQLASVAPQLLEAQKVAVVNRKTLADQTREFKKQPDESKLESFKPLLKAYQTEIDTLTKRSKAAENAFLNVHSALGTAPDPYPFLEVILEQAASLNDLDSIKQENARLKQEIGQLQDAASQTKAEESEREILRNRIKQLEEGFEAKTAERSAALEKELSAKWDERIRNLNEREKDLTRSLNLAQEQLKELKSKDESTTAKLLEKGHEEDEREVKGKLAEMELLSRDLERAQTRIESVERRNEQLRAEIESVKSGRQENDKVQQLEKEAQEKDRKIAQLQTLIEKQRQEATMQASQAEAAEDEKAKLVKDKEAVIESLRAKLHQRRDYEEIKRELEIVKMVHFSADDDDGAESINVNGSNGDNAEAGTKPLEALLLEKNKKLEDQLTTLRIAHDELTTSSRNADGELRKLKNEVTRLKSLNESLENDLVSIGKEGRPPASRGAATMSVEEALKEMDLLEAEASGKGSSSRSKNSTTMATSNKNSNEGAIRSPDAAATPHASTSATPTTGGESSILSIITSQRDRFRSRNAELEEELRKQFETISELRSEVKTLQSDNLGLYEKVRYLQSRGGRGDAVIHFGNDVAVAGRTDASGAYPPLRVGEDKYRAKYEESMNPFEAFRGREQGRAMAQLNPLERALHMLTRIVLSHRRMRLLFMIYAIFLHAMVFGMLFEVSTTSSTQTCAVNQGARSGT